MTHTERGAMEDKGTRPRPGQITVLLESRGLAVSGTHPGTEQGSDPGLADSTACAFNHRVTFSRFASNKFT